MTIKDNYHHLLHPEATTDILQTIPDEDLPKLRDIYKLNWPHAIQAWHLINQLISWKKLNPNVGVRLTSPDGYWQDGTFVAIFTEYKYRIYFFTLDRNCKRLCKALKETKLIEWKKGPHICAIHEDYEAAVMKCLHEVNGQIDFDVESSCWFLDKEIAANYKINNQKSLQIKPLPASYASIMNEFWPHKFANSEKYLANIIMKNGGYGIFTNTSPEILCSWLTINEYGAIAVLQTMDQYKRRGYAAILIQHLCQRAAVNNLDSITYILRKNIASQTLFKRLGFVKTNNIKSVQFKNLEK